MKTKSLNKWMPVTALPALMAFANTTDAAILDLSLPFSSGTVAPANSIPWLRITTTTISTTPGAQIVSVNFDTGGLFAPGSIPLGSGLNGNEFIDSVFLNIGNEDTTIDLSQISASVHSSSGMSPPSLPISVGKDSYKADGDKHLYDARIDFATGGDNSVRFTSGDTLSLYFTYTGSGTFVADYFNALNYEPGKSEGIYTAASHVQATTGGGSAWIASDLNTSTVPEPSSGVLSMLTATACCVFARKRRDLKA